MKDEAKAPSDYAKLKKNLKSKQNKKVISRIMKDERRHLKALKKIKKSKTK